VGFVVNKVTLGQVSPVNFIPPVHHYTEKREKINYLHRLKAAARPSHLLRGISQRKPGLESAKLPYPLGVRGSFLGRPGSEAERWGPSSVEIKTA
jgi:hypothetical protein